MKKILLIIVLFLALTVNAKENKLYFVEDNELDRVVYESGLFNDKMFMNHKDMTPGDKFTDELIIENGTKTDYTLYFRVVPKEQSIAAANLLDNIIMKITMDGVIVFEGKANGMGTQDLLSAVSLGEIAPKKSYKMVVDTYLSTDYITPSVDDLAMIDWEFYAQYDKQEPKEIIPKTSKDSSNWFLIFAILLIIAASILIAYNNYNREPKKVN